MSRHKIVKNMDLDNELDDFDGGEDYYDDGDDNGLQPPSSSLLPYKMDAHGSVPTELAEDDKGSSQYAPPAPPAETKAHN